MSAIAMDGGGELSGFVFGRWRVVTRRRELLAEGRPVALGARAFDVLHALLDARGATVSTDELLAKVWPSAVVEVSNLRAQIAGLRKALGPEGADLIANVARRGYRFTGELVALPRRATAADDQYPAGRPSIAVLPFHNLSPDARQDYFAEGIAEELTTALSRFGWLLVVARNSSFAFRGQEVDVAEVGQRLGVRYAIQGSVRRAHSRVRITAQLVETATRRQLWADRFDGRTEDVFDLQDQVSASVVGAIEPRLRRVEATRARAKPTGSLDAYEHYLRALWHLFPRTRANYADALAQLDAALALDPDFALAMALAAHCHHTRCAQGWSTAHRDEAEAVRLAEAALAEAPDDPEVLAHAANTLAFYGRGLQPSIQLVARSLVLNPNSAFAWFVDGWLHLHAGEPELAVDRFSRARRLSPLDPMAAANASAATAQAHLLLARTDEAIDWARRAVREAVDYAYPHRVLTAALAHAGHVAQARETATAMLRIEPCFTVRGYLARTPLRDSPALLQLAEGLRLAGLPEL